ncbi:MAG: hypothetical protein R3C58_00930 [Parvularculaceae bacterium]
MKKIAFIRNPFTHAYSLYAHILRSPSNPHHGAMKSASFADMLRQRYLPYKGLQRAYVSAADPIDFVGRFECFEEDARNLERFLGLPRPLVLERANVNPAGGPDLCEAFAGVLDEFVEKLAWQFSFFGYSTDIARAHEPPAFAPAPEISAAARWGDKEDAPARRDNPCVP